MRFALDASHRDFAASIDGLLSKADMPAVIRAWSIGDVGPGQKVWQALAETGVNGLLVAEEYGGLGADPIDVVVAAEQLGRHAVPGPVAETIAVAPALLVRCAPDRVAELASGSLATVAAAPHVPFAVDADSACVALLVADGTVSVASAGAQQNSVDKSRRLFALTAQELLGEVSFERAFDLGVLTTAAQLQGLGQTLLDLSTDHARQRTQFGRPIGQFQAVGHQLAEVAVGLEMSRPLLHGAAVSMRDGIADASRDVSAAKVACGDAAYRAARVALQVHGAIGFTREHDLSLFLTKVRALITAWGTPAYHRGRVVDSLIGAS
ncbi:acyl-CoA dehydrogenase family protein [Rhodococcoides yunnanense]|uniref:acyl-CoA dehydrogenase family protein n=1 Tax=Rhodococcoides yunnanense TaxID=278209 RepID=UPI0009344B17|nr:acyl-CoA dehydrogenase [Rhodococcus yunnanensis]